MCLSSSAKVLEIIFFRDLPYPYRKTLSIRIATENIDQIAHLQCPNCELRYCFPATCWNGRCYETLQNFPWCCRDNKYEFRAAKQYPVSGKSFLVVGCASAIFAEFVPQGCTNRGPEFNTEAPHAKATLLGLLVNAFGTQLPLVSCVAVSRLVRWPLAALSRPIGRVARIGRQLSYIKSMVAISVKPLERHRGFCYL
jgi:hypothetical protein